MILPKTHGWPCFVVWFGSVRLGEKFPVSLWSFQIFLINSCTKHHIFWRNAGFCVSFYPALQGETELNEDAAHSSNSNSQILDYWECLCRTGVYAKCGLWTRISKSAPNGSRLTLVLGRQRSTVISIRVRACGTNAKDHCISVWLGFEAPRSPPYVNPICLSHCGYVLNREQCTRWLFVCLVSPSLVAISERVSTELHATRPSEILAPGDQVTGSCLS